MTTEIDYDNVEIDFGNGVTRSASANKADLQSGARLSDKIQKKKALDLDGVFNKSEIEEIQMVPVRSESSNSRKPRP